MRELTNLRGGTREGARPYFPHTQGPHRMTVHALICRRRNRSRWHVLALYQSEGKALEALAGFGPPERGDTAEGRRWFVQTPTTFVMIAPWDVV